MRFRNVLNVILALAASSTAVNCLSMAAGAQTYSILDLGVSAGSNSEAEAINASGQAVGYASGAVLFSGGQVTRLGTLGGQISFALAINRSGDIVGYSTNAARHYSAFLWKNGTMISLGPSTYLATAINDSGQIAGSLNLGNTDHAFLYDDGNITDLGTLGGEYSAAYGINNAGWVVGYAYNLDGTFRAFLYANGGMRDLGTLGGDYSRAAAVNTAGQITGEAYLPGNTAAHAFLYGNGGMRDLGALSGSYSEGTAINSFGVVVGDATVKSNSGYLVYHAVIFRGRGAEDLNRLVSGGSGWVLDEATGINDSGQIVGYGEIHGETHAFLLSPR